MFSSDFEASGSPDPRILDSRLSVPRNPEFFSTLDMGSSGQSNTGNMSRFFSPLDGPRSQPAHMLSSVSTLSRLLFSVYIPQKPSMSFQPRQNSAMGPYDPVIPRTNTMFEEYIKVRTERDVWHARYTEVK